MDEALWTTGRPHGDAPVAGRLTLAVLVEECALSNLEEAEAVHETHPADSDFHTHASPAGCGGRAGMNSTTTERQAMTPLPTSGPPRPWPYGAP